MNKRRLSAALIILFSLLAVNLAAQNPSNITTDSFTETAGTGLVINTNPSNVTVFIDGAERGKTPITFQNMTQGIYNIRLTKDGYKERGFNVTLFNTSRLVVSIKMEEDTGSARITVYRSPESPDDLPLNPHIFVSSSDNASLKPVNDNTMLINLPIGFHYIRVRAFGWEDASEIITISDNSTVIANIYMKPAQFKLVNAAQSRRRFNPLNSNKLGENEYRVEVTAPGNGTITIFNSGEEIVYNANIGDFDSAIQHIKWNGRDSEGNPLPQGIYTVKIEASGFSPNASDKSAESFTLELKTEVNYSMNIIPLSLESGMSGLTFAPMPHTIPQGSYQFDANIFFGSFFVPEKGDTLALPLLFNMRISPLNKLELHTGVNVNPYFANDTSGGFTGWGISGSVKYNFLSIELLTLTAGATYSWTGEHGDLPLNPGRGIGAHLPLSVNIDSFSIIFCPSIFWYGPAGYIPSLFLSAGAVYFGNIFNAGLSARCELDFSKDTLKTKVLTGAEVHLFPSPSNLFFSFSAGMTFHEQSIGGYGGFKIGIIN